MVKQGIFESGTKIKIHNVPNSTKKGDDVIVYFTDYTFRTNRWEYANKPKEKEKGKKCKIIE